MAVDAGTRKRLLQEEYDELAERARDVAFQMEAIEREARRADLRALVAGEKSLAVLAGGDDRRTLHDALLRLEDAAAEFFGEVRAGIPVD